MSAASDKFENDVAKNINKLPGVTATRPKVGTDYSDVKIEIDKFKGDNSIWLEVKMNHTDNLSNPRVFYEKGKWQTTYKTPSAAYTVDMLNRSPKEKKFIKDIAKFSGIPEKNIKIPTTKSGLKEPGAVPLKVMKDFFEQPSINRYIASEENTNMTKIVTEHYTLGKTKPAYYMQAGDDFYMISKKNPLKIQGPPIFAGYGNFKVRVATRSEFYEVQAEIKVQNMLRSKFSVAPGTKKENPFVNMKK